jgi:hypothetical protein
MTEPPTRLHANLQAFTSSESSPCMVPVHLQQSLVRSTGIQELERDDRYGASDRTRDRRFMALRDCVRPKDHFETFRLPAPLTQP